MFKWFLITVLIATCMLCPFWYYFRWDLYHWWPMAELWIYAVVSYLLAWAVWKNFFPTFLP